MIIKIFYAIFLVVLWFSLIKYRRQVKSWTGNFVWAEHYLWAGGTYLIMIIFWMFLMFLGVLYPFGWLELIFGSISKWEL